MIVAFTVVMDVDLDMSDQEDMSKHVESALLGHFRDELSVDCNVITFRDLDIRVPKGATHYIGDPLDEPSWYKVLMVGVVGAHWFRWNPLAKTWVLWGYQRPEGLRELPPMG